MKDQIKHAAIIFVLASPICGIVSCASQLRQGPIPETKTRNENCIISAYEGGGDSCPVLAIDAEKEGRTDDAAFYYSRSCRGLYLPACLLGGDQLEKQNKSEEARELYKIGCDGGQPENCMFLAGMKEKAGDIAEATRLVKSACQKSSSSGCVAAGKIE